MIIFGVICAGAATARSGCYRWTVTSLPLQLRPAPRLVCVAAAAPSPSPAPWGAEQGHSMVPLGATPQEWVQPREIQDLGSCHRDGDKEVKKQKNKKTPGKHITESVFFIFCLTPPWWQHPWDASGQSKLTGTYKALPNSRHPCFLSFKAVLLFSAEKVENCDLLYHL